MTDAPRAPEPPAPDADPAPPSGDAARDADATATAPGDGATAPAGSPGATVETLPHDVPTPEGAQLPGGIPPDGAGTLPAGGAPRGDDARGGPRANRRGFLAERDEVIEEVPAARLRARSRRDFLAFAAGALAVASGAWFLLPDRTRSRLLPGAAHDRLDTLAARAGLTRERREQVLDRALSFDDDVAEALYSPTRRVRTYRPSDATPLRNNYHGRTPMAASLAGWRLQLEGLASGRVERLGTADLLARVAWREQVTRLVCVEGWSAVAWWGGVRFADLLAAFPPRPGARWAALRSDVGLDGAGRPDPYYVSIDLATARHPQTLLATHHGGRPLTLAHGAPLRLVAPVKLGLKHIKAITHVVYAPEEPPDYWNQRGYSRYDGL